MLDSYPRSGIRALLGSAAAHVVVDGDTAHLRDADGALEECAYPVAG